MSVVRSAATEVGSTLRPDLDSLNQLTGTLPIPLEPLVDQPIPPNTNREGPHYLNGATKNGCLPGR